MANKQRERTDEEIQRDIAIEKNLLRNDAIKLLENRVYKQILKDINLIINNSIHSARFGETQEIREQNRIQWNAYEAIKTSVENWAKYEEIKDESVTGQ